MAYSLDLLMTFHLYMGQRQHRLSTICISSTNSTTVFHFQYSTSITQITPYFCLFWDSLTGIDLSIFLPQVSTCWVYRPALSHQAKIMCMQPFDSMTHNRVWAFLLHMSLSIFHVNLIPTEARRGCWVPGTGVQDSCRTPHVLGTESSYYTRAASALNC